MLLKSKTSVLLLLPLFWSISCKQKEIHEQPLADEINLGSSSEIVIDDEEFEIVEVIGPLEQSLIDAGLVDVEDVIPGILVDLKYSTEDNFFGQDVYGELIRCYLQPVVADMLKNAYEKLKEDHPELTFLVYDGVRPLSVQQILWDSLDKPDSVKPLYVADPKVGGLHNFGVAVDLTLAFAETGEPLDMGTHYDYFGYPAYPDREAEMLREGIITKEQISNREILRKVMKHGGFTGIGSEWWHFNAYSLKDASARFELVK
ncbi:M15 family metallopeptidase [Shivajiella indica]|uniref:D-alanyl-D-alanine dipeptidase n=1 Tax=Shivajiella indica TaxID=872115 RepID=A0ABW5B2A6_9BACT